MTAASYYTGPSLHTNYLLWVIVGLAITGVVILALYLYDHKVQRVKELKAALIENVKQGPFAEGQELQKEEDNSSEEEQER